MPTRSVKTTKTTKTTRATKARGTTGASRTTRAKKKGEDAHEIAPGIPRTHGAARKIKGYKKADHKFDDLSDEVKRNFIKLADSGARAGSFCGATIINNGADYYVCYKNAQGSCHWVQIPRGSPIPPNDPT